MDATTEPHSSIEVSRPMPVSGPTPEWPAGLAGLYLETLSTCGYRNARKLAAVFEFWLFNYSIGLAHYPEMPAHCLNHLIHFSALDDIHFKKQTKEAPRNVAVHLKKMVWRLASLLPLKCIVLPGGIRSSGDAFMANVSHYKLLFRKTDLNPALKTSFVAKLKASLPPLESAALEAALPDAFFQKQVRPLAFPKAVHGSPSAFLEETYLKALFTAKELELSGYQHGANYGEMKVNRVEEYEKRISDTYFHWGLGEQNIRQNRFPEKPYRDRPLSRVVLVGSVKSNPFISGYFPGYDVIQAESKSNQLSFVPKLEREGDFAYMLHPKYRKTEGAFSRTVYLGEMDETAVHTTLFILDKPGHTFLYKAIYEGIPFLLYYNRDWNRYFTRNFQGFLEGMQEEGLLFHWDREEAFMERVRSLLKPGPFKADHFSKAKALLERGIG